LAQAVYNDAVEAKNATEQRKAALEELEASIQEFLESSGSTPNDIRTLAQEVLSKNITLRPEQIEELSTQIQDRLATLTDIEAILRATEDDLREAERLKEEADNAAQAAIEILNEAIQFKSELDKAREVQAGAEGAIDNVGENIVAADNDLKQISSETAEAERKATDSLREVEALVDRLATLQDKHFLNERRRDQAKNESYAALKNSTAVRDNAAQLKREYNDVSAQLENKLRLLDGAREKESVQNRATVLANSVNDKLKELQDMETEYEEHKRRAVDLTAEINSLTSEMEELLPAIKRIEDYHRTCNS